MFLFQL